MSPDMDRKKTSPWFKSLSAVPDAKAAPPPFVASKQKKDDDTFGAVPTLAKPYLTTGFRLPKTRDLALIIAGFSVLLLAPMIEYYVARPRDDREVLKSGFNVRAGDLGNGLVPEEGVTIVTPGTLNGQNENITPLLARDPAALIVRFWDGEPKEEPRPKPRIAQPRAEPEPDDWKSAVKSAVRRGVTRAAVSTRRTMTTGRLSKVASGFSSGSSSGSRSASAPSLSAPSHDGLFSSRSEAKSSLAPVQVSNDYRGAWRSGTAGTGGNVGNASSGGFLQPGRTLQGPGSGITEGSQIPGVSGGALSQRSSGSGSGPSTGADSEKISLTSAKDGRNITIEKKEDLNYERRKMEMQKAIDLKWEKKKYDQIERKKMLEQIAAQTASQAFLKVLDALLGNKKKGEGGDGGQGGGGGQ